MTLRLGPANCLSPQWQQGFFPDDLPPDWRLDYLANEYSCALILSEDLEALPMEGFERSELMPLFECAAMPSADDRGLVVVCASAETVDPPIRLSQIDVNLWQSQTVRSGSNNIASRFSLSTEQNLVSIKQQLLSLSAEHDHYFFLSAPPQLVSDTRQLCELLLLS